MNGPHLVTDPTDPRLDVFRDVRDRDLRGREGLFMAESELVLRRLLTTPERLHSLLLSPSKFDRLEDELSSLPDAVPVYTAEIEIMGSISGFHIHRGVLAAGIRPDESLLLPSSALGHLKGSGRCTLLVVEGVTNVDNIGAFFRNAAAFGADGLLFDATCVDPLYRKAVRVSMGHVLALPWAIAAPGTWLDTLQELRDTWELHLIGAETERGARPAWEIDWPERCAIIVGSEGSGLPGETIEACDELVEIPMDGSVPSLNVGLASGICLYERSRQAVCKEA
ncbi:MAG: RNA methyltransferase [Planctomycetota bacterium]|nr:RNA methyltransferase [Planctomycetota bacterium]